MIKQTLYFGNPAYLSLKNKQMLIRLPEVVKNEELPESFKENSEVLRPVEDIGVVILDHKQITITHGLLTALLENNVAIIQCNDAHHPIGLVLNLDGHTLQTQRFKVQIETSEPLKKQLWQQTVAAKIANQADLLRDHGRDVRKLDFMTKNVKSGDPDNYEARAAAYYWNEIFSNHIPGFRRERDGMPPNHLLNYGYSILRAAMARALVASGLLPTLGIYHRNQYNAYCLADDIMEPYRPFVDRIVYGIVSKGEASEELTLQNKQQLFSLLHQDAFYPKDRSPLLVGITKTTASLVACMEGKKRKISYPKLYAT